MPCKYVINVKKETNWSNNMTSSVPSTPRTNNHNSSSIRTPRRLCSRRSVAPAETPESCIISVETPVSFRRRASKEKSKPNEISNVLRVAVRVRPMNNRELSCSSVYDAIAVEQNELTVKHVAPGSIGVGTSHTFQYDHVFWSTDIAKPKYSSQMDVFLAMGKPMLDNAFRGYNACLFAYGQTGSGKSYSMMGEHCNIDHPNNDTAGIIPRFCFDLFSRIAELPHTSSATVELSYFEIYNEKIYDLLAIPACQQQLERRTPLKVREHPVWGPHVVNLSPHNVKSFAELRSLLQAGNKYRATAATVVNEKSSRSHSIVAIDLSVCEIDDNGTDSGRRSKISLVDLAGSERVGNMQNDDRHREGVSINQSLLTLGKVIAALSDPKRTNHFIPYRDSTLTWLLRESLGGNSLTSMLATISPASSNVDETLATLRYACQARSIVNRAYVNENPHDRLIRELRAEVERLRALRQDYERQSITPITPQIDDTSLNELDELRLRLSETERNLDDAQRSWEKRFLDTKQKQLRELADAERRKEELESHVRVMSTLEKKVVVSPYKSNFLADLEDVLIDVNKCDTLINDANEWCLNYKLNVRFAYDEASDKLIVNDIENDMYAECNKEQLENRFEYDGFPVGFLDCFDWRLVEKSKKHSKETVYKYVQQIRKATAALKTIVEDDVQLQKGLNQLYTAVQSFEASVNQKYHTKKSKMVKFQT